MSSPVQSAIAAECPSLVLYSRQGCCLCEALEQKLLALNPPLPLTVIDVDRDPALQARFGLEVPLLAWRGGGLAGGEQVLPRVPPRLQAEALQVWLQKHGFPARSA